MRLKETEQLLEVWRHAMHEGANVILMRHAPKEGDDTSSLSPEGAQMAEEYGDLLWKDGITSSFLWSKVWGAQPHWFCTSKPRTQATLHYLFPYVPVLDFKVMPDLEVNRVGDKTQELCNELHRKIGHWRGYQVSHTYYFLEKLGGCYDEENLHTEVKERMVRGITSLFNFKPLSLYCGHSPSIEVALEELLGCSIAELGGFLNPLDSIHLKKVGDKIKFVARVNPIEGYEDKESQKYFMKQ